MARTDATAVKAILLDQYDTEGAPSLTAFIDTATVMVDDLVTCISSRGLTAFSAAKLERIEAFLTAHLYLHADQSASSKTTGDASATFQGQTGMGFKSTQFGQAALSLDTSGCLARVDKQMSGDIVRPSMTWLGKPNSEQIPYAQRD
jgi:hypothetical protein